MPSKTDHVPSYRCQKRKGKALAFAEFPEPGLPRPVRIYFGQHGTKESCSAYDRTIAEWLEAGRRLPAARLGANPDICTVDVLLDEFLRWAEGYYPVARNGNCEAQNFRMALKPWRKLYGATPVADFGPNEFKAVRQSMVTKGLARSTINAAGRRVRQVLKWGVEHELVKPEILHTIQAVAPLKRDRSEAKEAEKRGPVADDVVTATLPYRPRPVRGLVELQRVTGTRAGELLGLKVEHLDRTGPVWIATLEEHKNAYRDQRRKIYIGPKGQAVLAPFILRTPAGAYIFRPADSFKERSEKAEGHRRKNQKPTRRRTKRRVRDAYDVNAYRRVIDRACTKAGVEHWSPHQLRHTAATEIAKNHGTEIARVLLGHARIETTLLYAEIDDAAAKRTMEQIG